MSLRIEYDERAISQAAAFLGDPQGLREVLDAIDRLADVPIRPVVIGDGGDFVSLPRVSPGQAAHHRGPSADPARARDLRGSSRKPQCTLSPVVHSIPEDDWVSAKPKRSSTRPPASARTFVLRWTSCTQGPSRPSTQPRPERESKPVSSPAAHPERVPEHRRRLTWRDRALKELEDLADVMPAAALTAVEAMERMASTGFTTDEPHPNLASGISEPGRSASTTRTTDDVDHAGRGGRPASARTPVLTSSSPCSTGITGAQARAGARQVGPVERLYR